MNKTAVLTIMSEVLNIDIDTLIDTPTSTRLEDIGMTSLAFIRFIVKAEEAFDFEMLDSDLVMSHFDTIDNLLETLAKYDKPQVLKKVLICDCDNVLWHGIAGEESLSIDNNIHRFHELLINLQQRGILICLCSRNQQQYVEEAFQTLALPLTSHHITSSRINTSDKYTNIGAIAEELNLSLDSVVFVDDSDYELGMINALLPDVTTLKADHHDPAFLDRLSNHFATTPASSIDRTMQYKQQKLREQDRINCSSVEEYNASLQTQICCRPATTEDAQRIAELSQRTNQFNLSAVRMTTDDIVSFLCNKQYRVYTVSVSDRYGDMGVVGAAVVHNNTITAFMISCRVFDRGVENVLLQTIQSDFSMPLRGIYCKTDKNGRFQDFFAENGVILYE